MVRLAISLVACLALTACWESDRPLIAEADRTYVASGPYFEVELTELVPLGSIEPGEPRTVVMTNMTDTTMTDYKAWLTGQPRPVLAFTPVVLSVEDACRIVGVAHERDESWVYDVCTHDDAIRDALSDQERDPLVFILEQNLPGSDRYTHFVLAGAALVRTQDQLADLTGSFDRSFVAFSGRDDITSLDEIDVVGGLIEGMEQSRRVPENLGAAFFRGAYAHLARIRRISEAEATALAAVADYFHPASEPEVVEDREPTEYEMSEAIRRSTLGGAMLNVSIRKLGRCERHDAFQYVCRYRWLGENRGWFWFEAGAWRFQIIDS